MIQSGRGPVPKFCSGKCRVSARRAKRRLPAPRMGGERWTRADGKRPIQTNCKPASTTDFATWADHAEVAKSKAAESAGRKRGNVERYTRTRFIRMAGRRFQ